MNRADDTAADRTAPAGQKTLADQKTQWRRTLSAARRARPDAEIARARAAVTAHALRRAGRDGWRCVAAFVPLRTEPGSVDLLGRLADGGVRVLVPVLRPDRDLDWAEWPRPGEPLAPDEVAAADALLVPALAVARDGTRLGRGGGSYDRALLRRAPGSVSAAVVYDAEVVPALPREPWDVPVDCALTPGGWRRLTGTRLDEE